MNHISHLTSDITATDLFCGCGGSSIALEAAGGTLKLAMNHWRRAVETHEQMFPHADHVLCDISLTNPAWYPRTTLLIAGPSCQNHSLSKGVTRKHGQKTMFEPELDDPSADRSRATAWDVIRFLEYHRHEAGVVENVVEFRHWELWNSWVHALDALGYAYQVVYQNSMFCHPVPQSRDRLYVVCWRKGNRAPNLDYRPRAWCECCGQNVDAVQSWKKPHAPWGRYGRTGQYIYRCPTCAGAVVPYYYAAANAIDWSLPAPRIGEREALGLRPLKQKTLDRIQAGLERFGTQAQPFAVDIAHSHSDSFRCTDTMEQPLPTQTTAHTLDVSIPPFLISLNHSNERFKDTTRESLATVMPQANPALAVPPGAFLASYYKEGGQLHRITDAMPTIPTIEKHALVEPEAKLTLEDTRFRMLEPAEIRAGMGFPEDYRISGNKREQIKQLGNAWTPPAGQWIIERIIESLDG